MVLYIVCDLDDNVLFSMYKQNMMIKNIIRRSKEIESKCLHDKYGTLRITTYLTKHYKLVKQVD